MSARLLSISLFSALAAATNACGAPADEDSVGVGSEPVTACSIPSFVSATPAPIGWASENGGTTGGGAAKVQIVTTLAQLNNAAKGSSPAVIYVSGSLDRGTATIGSNKTIIGCSGSAALNGHVDIKRASNVIIRNVHFVGYNCAPPDVDTSNGGQCQNGEDAVTIQQSQNVWLDHDAISNGSDGNLDVTHASDFITISYTKFFYSNARSDPHDTGSKGHRFSSLIGGSDSNGSQDIGHLNITWHHDWWADFVVERAPRVRFGKNHLFNNLWTNAGDDYCIGLGVNASIRSEKNAFDGVKSPFDVSSYSNSASALQSTGDAFYETSGNTSGKGSGFSPPYPYSVEGSGAVAADVRANAGPK